VYIRCPVWVCGVSSGKTACRTSDGAQKCLATARRDRAGNRRRRCCRWPPLTSRRRSWACLALLAALGMLRCCESRVRGLLGRWFSLYVCAWGCIQGSGRLLGVGPCCITTTCADCHCHHLHPRWMSGPARVGARLGSPGSLCFASFTSLTLVHTSASLSIPFSVHCCVFGTGCSTSRRWHGDALQEMRQWVQRGGQGRRRTASRLRLVLHSCLDTHAVLSHVDRVSAERNSSAMLCSAPSLSLDAGARRFSVARAAWTRDLVCGT